MLVFCEELNFEPSLLQVLALLSFTHLFIFSLCSQNIGYKEKNCYALKALLFVIRIGT